MTQDRSTMSEDQHRARLAKRDRLLAGLRRLPTAMLGVPATDVWTTCGAHGVTFVHPQLGLGIALAEPGPPAHEVQVHHGGAERDLLIVRADARDDLDFTLRLRAATLGDEPELAVTAAVDADARWWWLPPGRFDVGLRLTQTGLTLRFETPFENADDAAFATAKARVLLYEDRRRAERARWPRRARQPRRAPKHGGRDFPSRGTRRPIAPAARADRHPRR